MAIGLDYLEQLRLLQPILFFPHAKVTLGVSWVMTLKSLKAINKDRCFEICYLGSSEIIYDFNVLPFGSSVMRV